MLSNEIGILWQEIYNATIFKGIINSKKLKVT